MGISTAVLRFQPEHGEQFDDPRTHSLRSHPHLLDLKHFKQTAVNGIAWIEG
jgi:hypothetical protein